jgi:hypothetical protein
VTVPDFGDWPEAAVYRTRFSIDRQVWVDMLRVFPGLGSCARRQDELALWIKSGGLRLDPWMAGRQVAWLRRADGGWLALVLLPAASTNETARMTLQLWVEPDAITTTPPG